jgi:hypothetical protein
MLQIPSGGERFQGFWRKMTFLPDTLATALENGVTDGTRTHDNRSHNPGLYQLSYGHHKRKYEEKQMERGKMENREFG